LRPHVSAAAQERGQFGGWSGAGLKILFSRENPQILPRIFLARGLFQGIFGNQNPSSAFAFLSNGNAKEGYGPMAMIYKVSWKRKSGEISQRWCVEWTNEKREKRRMSTAV